MAKAIVIGGGIAGLSAAVYLAKNKIIPHLIEASPKLGGRAYSFNYTAQNQIIDNGQHIMMGCYKYTLNFLKMIGAENKINKQKNLHVSFIAKGGKLYNLASSSKIYPINLLIGMLRYNAVPLKDRIAIINVIAKLIFWEREKLSNLTVDEWLKNEKQSDQSIKVFWEILTVGTLNTTTARASALTFANVLKEIFLNGNEASTIILPAAGLSRMYCDDSEKFIKCNGGRVSLSERVVSLNVEGEKIKKVVTDKSIYTEFDFVVSAVPHHAFLKLIDSKHALVDPGFEYSPILNVHIWLKENPFREKFYGLIDSKVHWLFNNNAYISLTTSSADDFITKNNDEIIKIICNELKEYFPVFNNNKIYDYMIIKEKRATFIPTIEIEKARQKIYSPFINLILAGDWTNTGLPSTIESGVKSGVNAAELAAKVFL